jgi:hypothetical protein
MRSGLARTPGEKTNTTQNYVVRHRVTSLRCSVGRYPSRADIRGTAQRMREIYSAAICRGAAGGFARSAASCA